MERVDQVHWTEPLWKELHAISEDHDKLEQSFSPVKCRHPFGEKPKQNKKNKTIELSALDEFKIDPFNENDFDDCRLEKEKIDIGVQSSQIDFVKKLAEPKRSTTRSSCTTMTTRKKTQTNNRTMKRNRTANFHSKSIDNVPDKTVNVSSTTGQTHNPSEYLESETMNIDRADRSMKSNDVSETISYGWSDYSEIPTIVCDGDFSDIVSVSEMIAINSGYSLEDEIKCLDKADFHVKDEQTGDTMPKDVFVNKSVNMTDFEYHSPPENKVTERQDQYCTELKEYLSLRPPAVSSNYTSVIEKENEQCLATLRRTESIMLKRKGI